MVVLAFNPSIQGAEIVGYLRLWPASSTKQVPVQSGPHRETLNPPPYGKYLMCLAPINSEGVAALGGVALLECVTGGGL